MSYVSSINERLRCGEVAESVDATDSKSVARKGVWVQVPPPAFGTVGNQATVFEPRGRTASGH